MTWKQRKQIGLDPNYEDASVKLKREQDNLFTREKFIEWAKNSDGTLIEIGTGDFEMPQELIDARMVCICLSKSFVVLLYICDVLMTLIRCISMTIHSLLSFFVPLLLLSIYSLFFAVGFIQYEEDSSTSDVIWTSQK